MTAQTTEPDQPRPPPEIIRFTIPASRLAWGSWNHQRNRDEGEGDIHASYSADLIAMSGKVRRPFRFEGNLMVTVSLSRYEGMESAEAYRLIPENLFRGPPATYAEKVAIDNGDMARNDPNGFYHSMRVSFKAASSILCGPPVRFIAEPVRPDAQPEPEQMSLFT